MNNFNSLFERLASIHDKDRYEDEKIKDIISLGKNIDESFWDNFLILLSNTDSFSILFDIPEEKISSIYRKIKKYLNNHKDDNYIKSNKTRKLL